MVLTDEDQRVLAKWFTPEEPLDPMELPASLRSGRCYEMAFRRLLHLNSDDWVLVQGFPRLRAGEHAGRRYGHAWLERTDYVEGFPFVTVWDPSTGQVLPAGLYYNLGYISEEHCRRWRMLDAVMEAYQQDLVGAWHLPADLGEEPVWADPKPHPAGTAARRRHRGASAGPKGGHTPSRAQTVEARQAIADTRQTDES